MLPYCIVLKKIPGCAEQGLCARPLGTPPSMRLGAKSYAGLGTKSWCKVWLRSLGKPSKVEVSKSILPSFLWSLRRTLVKSYAESYAESYAVLCGGKS